MREIKFRVYEPLNKVMEYLDFSLYKVQDNSNLFVLPSERQCKNYAFMNLGAVEIMQYTGLHDKNDKEIYEGDIVAIDCSVDNSYYESWDINYPATERYDFQFRCSVIWVEETGGFGLEVEMCNLCKKARDKYDEDIENEMAEIRSGYFEWNELEVVGNIYENPELLEEQS